MSAEAAHFGLLSQTSPGSGMLNAMPRVVATLVTPWESDAVVVRLTAQIVRRHATTAEIVADAVVDLGRLMQRIQDRLERGEWGRWLDSAIPLTPRTIRNYLALAAWADAHPADFDRFRHLGPSKLYMLAAAPRPVIAALKARKWHAVPGSAQPKTLDIMLKQDLGHVIAGLTGHPAPTTAPVSITGVMRQYEKGVSRLEDTTALLIEHRTEVDREQAAAVHAQLRDMVQALGRAFRL